MTKNIIEEKRAKGEVVLKVKLIKKKVVVKVWVVKKRKTLGLFQHRENRFVLTNLSLNALWQVRKSVVIKRVAGSRGVNVSLKKVAVQ